MGSMLSSASWSAQAQRGAEADEQASHGAYLDAARLQQLRSRMQSYVDTGQVAGIVTLIAEHGRILSLDAFGQQDLETSIPMRTDTVFQVRSMTKSFTAASVLTLVDKGKVGLQDPVAKYIPEFANVQVADKSAGKATLRLPMRAVTIYDLLTHTAGLPPEPPREHTRQILQSKNLAEAAARVESVALTHDPGVAFSYSDLGYVVLGGVVEAASGKAFGEYVQEAILRPLEMNDSFLIFDREKSARVASTYRRVDGKLQKSDSYDIGKLSWLVLPRPSWSLFSTACDLLAFYQMLLNGGDYRGNRVLSPGAVRLMTSPHVAIGDTPAFYAHAHYGLGLVVKSDFDSSAMFGSPGSYGHGGLLGTLAWVDPDRQLVRIFLTSLAPDRPEDAFFAARLVFMQMTTEATEE
jgi:CubicO group peptidase (beta-lactamase class C family)